MTADLPPSARSRIGRVLRELYAGALEHADLPREAIEIAARPDDQSFDQEMRAHLASIEKHDRERRA